MKTKEEDFVADIEVTEVEAAGIIEEELTDMKIEDIRVVEENIAVIVGAIEVNIVEQIKTSGEVEEVEEVGMEEQIKIDEEEWVEVIGEAQLVGVVIITWMI